MVTRVRLTPLQIKTILVVLVFIIVSLLLLLGPLKEPFFDFVRFVEDREKLSAYIKSFGLLAPFVFIAMQVFQVVVAPIPGEVTGFLGGFLFGIWKGFIFSTIGLTIGAMISFFLARKLGRNFIQKLFSEKAYGRLNSLVTQNGKLVIFLMILMPGFPKDILGIFLGLTPFPAKTFFWFTLIGRLPVTMLLTSQGVLLYKENYYVFFITFGIFVIAGVMLYLFRTRMYASLERLSRKIDRKM